MPLMIKLLTNVYLQFFEQQWQQQLKLQVIKQLFFRFQVFFELI